MGILALIQKEKDKFRIRGREYSKEEINSAKRGLVQGDIEVYDAKKKSVGEMISNAKQKFKQTKTRLEMMKEEHQIKKTAKLKKDLENLKLQSQIAKQKQQIQKAGGGKRGLRAILGEVNVPTVQRKEFGGNPFPGTERPKEKKNIVQEEGRNALGGKDPFG
jgi:CxxC motif-containing protein